MDDYPSSSIFQSANFNIIRSDSPSPEELEAQQDQLRYDAEVKEILAQEFANIDFGNSSVDSSSSFSSSCSVSSTRSPEKKSKNRKKSNDKYPTNDISFDNNRHNNRSLEKESKNRKKSNDRYPTNDFSPSDNNRHRLKADYSNVEQLEALYSVRLREIEQLRGEIQYLKDKYEADRSELSTALKQAVVDKERTADSRNEIQQLLLETTNRLSETEKELSSVRQKCMDSEKIKSNALNELKFKEIEHAKLEQQLADIRRAHESALNEKIKVINKLNEDLSQCHSQYQTLAKSKSHDVTKIANELKQQNIENEVLKREIASLKEKIVEYESISRNNTRRESDPSKHKTNYPSPKNINSTMKLKEEELQQALNELKSKEINYAKLEQQLIDLQSAHESALNEKTKVINKLNENLMQCHSQYQTLAKSKSHGVTKIANELQQQKIENEVLKREIASLKEKIVEYESIISRNSTRCESDPSKHKTNNPSPTTINDTLKLKEKLQQATTNLTTKLTEIKNLQDKLLASSKEIKSLKNDEIKYMSKIEALKEENENLSAELVKSQQEQEMLKIGVMDYVTKTDILHKEQLSELELVSSKKILELEAKLKEMEVHIKENSIRVFAEEINRITGIYSNHFDKLSETLERLKIELDERSIQMKQMNNTIEKLNSEINVVYNKYKNTRKVALGLKNIVEDRTLLLKQRNEQYLQSVQDIQKSVYTVLIGKVVGADKLTELIEKSMKNVVRIEDLLANDERNAIMCDIDKKLSFLEKPDI